MQFLQDNFHPENLTGSPQWGDVKEGVEKTSHYLALCINISKTVADTCRPTSKVTISF